MKIAGYFWRLTGLNLKKLEILITQLSSLVKRKVFQKKKSLFLHRNRIIMYILMVEIMNDIMQIFSNGLYARLRTHEASSRHYPMNKSIIIEFIID